MGEMPRNNEAADRGGSGHGSDFGRADPWALLACELDAWTERPASFWLRDDDATGPSDALDRLLSTADRHGVSVTLAVIPAFAERTLAQRVAMAGRVHVIQHGWDHADHAASGQRRVELGGGLGADQALAALARGRTRLEQLFGSRFLAVLAPPWNRIAPEIEERVGEAGLAGLSLFGARAADDRRRFRRNVHIDPILWHDGERFAGTEAMLSEAVRHLRARRLGEVADEPTGLMTHHLRHDAETDRFIDAFLAATVLHRNVRWLDAMEVFAECDDGRGAADAA